MLNHQFHIFFKPFSLGLSDLHGDGRVHPRSDTNRTSGFGFELTFRLVRQRGEKSPPTWPANVMQQLAKYVFTSGNILMPGDHVSWHAPLDAFAAGGAFGNVRPGKINQILMGKDAQLPACATTPHGEVRKTFGCGHYFLKCFFLFIA